MRIVTSFPVALMCSMLAHLTPARQPFALTLLEPAAPVNLEAQLELTLKFTNTSSEQITIRDKNRWCDYELEIYDSRGFRVSPTDYKRELKCGGNVLDTGGRNSIKVLRPGDSFTELLIINQAYELKYDGRYTIRVSRAIPTDLGGGTAMSNLVALTLTK